MPTVTGQLVAASDVDTAPEMLESINGGPPLRVLTRAGAEGNKIPSWLAQKKETHYFLWRNTMELVEHVHGPRLCPQHCTKQIQMRKEALLLSYTD